MQVARRLDELGDVGHGPTFEPGDRDSSCLSPPPSWWPKDERIRIRAAILSALATSDAHLTTVPKRRPVEDRLQHLSDGVMAPRSPEEMRQKLAPVDRELLALVVSTEEWDVLYRQRLQIECAFLRGLIAPDCLRVS
jgi:hypothetical protein